VIGVSVISAYHESRSVGPHINVVQRDLSIVS